MIDGRRHYDFYPMLQMIAPYVERADGHLSRRDADDAAAAAGSPVFNTPPALASAIKRTGGNWYGVQSLPRRGACGSIQRPHR